MVKLFKILFFITLYVVLLSAIDNNAVAAPNINTSSSATYADSGREYIDIGCVWDGSAQIQPAAGDEVDFVFSNTAPLSTDIAYDAKPSVTLPANILFATTNVPTVIVSGTSVTTGLACVQPSSVSFSPSLPSQTITFSLGDGSGGDYDLEPGCILTVNTEIYTNTSISAGVYAISSEMDYSLTDGGAVVGSPPDEGINITVNEGSSIVTKTPDNSTGAVGDQIDWTVVVTNTGSGGLCDLELVDTPSSVTIDSINPALTSSYLEAGENYTINVVGTITGCEDIGNNVEVYHLLKPSSGGTSDSEADSTITLDLETPLIAFTTGPTSPGSLPYNGSAQVCVDIENEGRGDAFSLKLNATIPSCLTVSGVSSGWSYASDVFTYTANGGTLANMATSQLCFDVTPDDNCSSSCGGNLVWSSDYQDGCTNSFAIPTSLSSVPQTSGFPSATISKTNSTGDSRVDVGETGQSYTLTVSISDAANIDGTDVTITDVLPDSSDLASVGVLTASSGTASCGGGTCDPGETLTWTFAQSDGTETLDIPFSVTTDECRAGNTINNTGSFALTYQVGALSCPLNDSDGSNILITNNGSNVVDQDFNVNGSASGTFEAGLVDDGDGVREIEEGEFLPFEANYVFGSGYSGTWVDSTFEDDFGGNDDQSLVPNSVEITLSNGPSGNGTYQITNFVSPSTPQGFAFELDFLAAQTGEATMADYDVDITYRTTVARDGIGTRTQKTTLTVGGNPGGGGTCVSGGETKITQGAFITITRANADVNINIPNTIAVCEEFNAVITIEEDQPTYIGSYDPSNILVELLENGSSYEVTNPVNYSYGGEFTSGITQFDNVNPFFQYDSTGTPSTPPGNELANNGTITAAMLLSPGYTTGLPSLSANLFYDDNQSQLTNDDVNSNNPLTQLFLETDSDAPLIVNKAELAITTSPQTVVMSTQQMIYTVYVTNTGPSTAYGSELIVDITSDFTLNEADTNAANGTAANGTNTRPVGNVDYSSVPQAEWDLGDISPGGTVQVEVVADIDAGRGCSATTDGEITTRWGCSSPKQFQETITKSNPALIFPTGKLAIQHVDGETNCSLCNDGKVVLSVTNTGITDIFEVIINEDLNTPTSGISYASANPNLQYCLGETSAANCTSNGSWVNADTNPSFNLTAGTVSINENHITALARLVPQSEADNATTFAEMFVRFDVTAGEDAVLNQSTDISVSGSAESPCEATITSAASVYPFDVDQPLIVVDKKGVNLTEIPSPSAGDFVDTVYATAGEDVRWRITVTNNGDETAEFVRLEDMLPSGQAGTITNVTGPGVSSSPNDDFIISVSDIPINTTNTYFVDMTLSTTCVNDDNFSRVTYGCSSNGANSHSNLVPSGNSLYPNTNDMAQLIMISQVDNMSISHSYSDLSSGRIQAQITIDYEGANTTLDEVNSNLSAFTGGEYIIETGSASATKNGSPLTVTVASDPSPDTNDYTFGLNGTILENNDTIILTYIITTSGYEDATNDDLTNPETSPAGSGFDPDVPADMTNDVSVSIDNSCGDNSSISKSATYDTSTPDLDMTVNPVALVLEDLTTYDFDFIIRNNGETGSIADNANFILDAGSGWLVNSLRIGSTNCTSTSNCNESDIGSLSANGTVTITANATAPAATVGGLDLSMRGAITGAIENGSENYSSDSAKIRAIGFNSDKTLSSTSEAYTSGTDVAIGEQITFLLRAEWFGNQGGAQVENITLTDTLPTGLGYVSHAATGNNTVTINGSSSFPSPVNSGNLIFNIDDNTGGVFEVEVVAQVLNIPSNITNGAPKENLTNTFEAEFEFEGQNFNPTFDPNLSVSSDVDVIHPEISISKLVENITDSSGKVTSTSGDANDSLRYYVTITNNGDAPMFDLVVLDQLQTENISLITTASTKGLDHNNDDTIDDNGGAISSSGGQDNITFNETNTPSGNANSLARLDPGETITVIYQAEIDIEANPEEVLTNSVTVTGSSIDDANNNPDNNADDELTINDNDSTSITTDSIIFDKAITDTAITDTTGVNLAVGEQVEYTISVTLPEGTVDDFNVRDILPANLIYIATTDITSGSSISPSLSTTEPSTSGSGPTTLIWDFDSLEADGTNRDITITYVAQVANNTANNNATSFTNSASYNQDVAGGGSYSTADTESSTVVEPIITTTKTITSTGPYESGDEVTFRISVSNSGAANAVAYNLNIRDILPVDLVYTTNNLSYSSTPTGGQPANQPDYNNGNRELVLGFNQSSSQIIDLEPGDTITFDVTIDIEDTIEPQEVLNSDLFVTWTSLSDPSNDKITGTIGSNGAANGARDGSGATTAPNDNYQTQDVDVVIDNDFSIAKTETSSGTTGTGGNSYEIGDTVEYQIVFNVQNGTVDDFVVEDILPAGLQFNQTVSITPASGGNFTYVAPTAQDNSNVITWDFGTIVNASDGNDTNDAITIVYDAIIIDNPTFPEAPNANYESTDQTNSAKIEYVNSSDVAREQLTPTDPTINVAQPNLTIVKTIESVGTEYEDGENVQYKLAITNDGSAPAYNIIIKDTLPEGINDALVVLDSAVIGATNLTPTQTNDPATAQTGLTTDRTVTWDFGNAVTLDRTETLEITYTVTVDDNVGANQTISNNGEVNQFCTNLDSNPNSRCYSDFNSDSVDITTPTPDDLLKAVTNPDNANNEANVGEQIIYDITIPQTPVNSAINGVNFIDNLPAGLILDTSAGGGNGVEIVAPTDAKYSIDVGNSTINTGTVGDGFNNPAMIDLEFTNSVTSSNTIEPNEQIHLRIYALVDNNANTGNDTGETSALNNTASFDFTGSGGAINSNTVTTTVSEPDIDVTKTAIMPLPDPIEGGATISYQVTLTNNGNGDAHNVVLQDIGDEILNYDDISITSGNGSITFVSTVAGSGADLGKDIHTFNYTGTIAPTESVELQIDFIIDNSVTSFQQFDNRARSTWQSTASGTNGRTGAGGVNDYDESTAEYSLNASGVMLTKTEEAPSLGEYPIGSEVNYKLRFDGIISGVDSLMIKDILPSNMELDSFNIFVLNYENSSNPGSPATLQGASPSSGDTGTLTFNFGDVDYNDSLPNPNGSNGAMPYIEIDITAIIQDNTTEPVRGDTLSNSGEVDLEDVDGNMQTVSLAGATPDIDVTEPELVLALDGPADVAASVTDTYTVNLEHLSGTSNASAYQPEIEIGLPAELHGDGGASAGYPPENFSLVISGGTRGQITLVENTDYTATYNASTGRITIQLLTAQSYIATDENLAVNFDLTADDDVTSSSSIADLTATVVDYYSVDNSVELGGGAANDNIRSYPTTYNTGTKGTANGATGDDETDDHSVNAVSPDFSKIITDTAVSDTVNDGTNEELTIGEQVEFTVTLTLPQGEIADLNIRDILPENYTYISTESITIGDSITPSTIGDNEPNEVTNGTNNELTWDFDARSVNGANRDIVIVYYAQAANSIANVNGITFDNQAQYNFNLDGGVDYSTAETASAEIVEPIITSSMSVQSTGPYAAGDEVTYRIRVANDALARMPAYNLDISSILPTGLAFTTDNLSYVTLPTGGQPANQPDYNNGDRNLILGREQTTPQTIDLEPGDIIEFDVTVIVEESVEPEQVLTANSYVTWQSISDSDNDKLTGNLGDAGDANGARDGSDEASAPNDNYDTKNANVTISNNFAVRKTESSTGSTGSGGTSYEIGDEVEYSIEIDIQQGSVDNVIVTDTLPAGLTFDSTTSITPASGTNFTYNSPTAQDNSNVITWNFGTISNEPDSNATNDTITIVYKAIVTDNSTYPQAPAVGYDSVNQTNSAKLNYDNSSAVQQEEEVANEPTINVGQPNLSITKTIESSDSNLNAGDTVSYKIVIVNNGTAPAYNVSVLDTLGEGINDALPVLISADIDSVDVTPTQLNNPPSASSGLTTDRTVTWTLVDANTLDIGETLTLEYDITIDDDVAAFSTISNNASLNQFCTNVSSDSNSRCYNGFASSSDDFTTTGPDDLSKTVTNPDATNNEANIGEQVIYDIIIPETATSSSLTNVNLIDNLPAGMILDTSAGGGNGVELISPTDAKYSIDVGNSTISTGTVGDAINNPANLDLVFLNSETSSNKLDVGDRLHLRIYALVDNNSNIGTDTGETSSFVNQASFDFDENSGAAIDSTTVSTTVSEPSLTISKSAITPVPDPIEGGVTISYKLTITNSGNGAANNIIITDTADDVLNYDDVSIISGGGAIAFDSTTAGINGDVGRNLHQFTYNASIEPGATIEVQVDFIVSNEIEAYERIDNKASVVWSSVNGASNFDRDGSDGTSGGVNDYIDESAEFSLNGSGVSLTKVEEATGDGTYSIGDTVNYEIVLSNNIGGVNDVTIKDILPTNMELDSFTIEVLNFANSATPTVPATLVSTGPEQGDTGTLEFEFGDLVYNDSLATPNGQSGAMPYIQINLVAKIQDNSGAPERGDVITNNAEVDLTDDGVPITENLVGSAPDITIVEPELNLAFDSPSQIASGIPATFTLNVDHSDLSDNTGFQPKIVVELPDELNGDGTVDYPGAPPENFVVTINDGTRGQVILEEDVDFTTVYDPTTGQIILTFLSADSYIETDETLQINFDLTLDDNITDGATLDSPRATITEYYSSDNSVALGGGATDDNIRTYTNILGAGTTGTANENSGDDATDDAELNVVSATISFAKTISSSVGSTAEPSEEIIYTLRIENNGSTDAENITITDELPEYFEVNTLEIISTSPTTLTGSGTGGEPTIVVDGEGGANGKGSITISDLTVPDDNDNSDPILINYKATLISSIPNETAIINNAKIDIVGFDDIDRSVSIPTLSSPDIVIEKTSTEVADDDSMIKSGDIIRYTITIQNDGDEDVVNAEITDLVPDGTSYVANSLKLNGSQVSSSDGGVLSLNAGYEIKSDGEDSGVVLADGEQITLEFDVEVNSGVPVGTEIINTVFVTANRISDPDDNTIEESDSTSDLVGVAASLTAIKTVQEIIADDSDGASPLEAEETIRYTITINNAGSETAEDIVFEDNLDSMLDYITSSVTLDSSSQTDSSDSDSTQVSNGNITVNLGDLEAGSQKVITFDAKLKSSVSNGDIISNQAMVSYNEVIEILTDSDNDPTNGSQSTIISVGAEPIVKLTKVANDVNGGVFKAGDIVEYVLELSNISSNIASNVIISDEGANDTTFVSDSLKINGMDTALTIPLEDYNIGNLAAGETKVIRYRAQLSSSLEIGDIISNVASFNHDGSQCADNDDCISDSDMDDGVETGNNPDDPNDDDPTLVQIGGSKDSSSISGRIWEDIDHDREVDSTDNMLPNWQVQLYNNGTLIGSTTTDSGGNYDFNNLTPGPNYQIRFYPPDSSTPWGPPVSGIESDLIPDGTVNGPFIENLTLLPGINTPEQNLPVDPSGIVYNSITRAPIENAVVTLLDDSGNVVDASCLFPGQQNQTTMSDGFYRFDLLPTCPLLGTRFEISVNPPLGFIPSFPSSIIPPQTGPYIPADNIGGIDPIVPFPTAPAQGQDTTYYIDFIISPTSENVVNNHIAVDPILEGAIIARKTASKGEVSKGDIVPYQLTFENTLDVAIPNLRVVDILPPGFAYIANSARVDNVRTEPVISGRTLTWESYTIPASGTIEVTILAAIGTGVGEGDYDNRTYIQEITTGRIITNIATATVRIIPEPVFDCSDVIGKVFKDSNMNGYQDEGENGVPDVRLADINGLLINTDSYGRYHISCADVPNSMRGSNYALKLDVRSLPLGYKVTTENPRVIRLTRGKMSKANFGVLPSREIKITIKDDFFNNPENRNILVSSLIKEMEKSPVVIKLRYLGNSLTKEKAKQILNMINNQISDTWGRNQKSKHYKPLIEMEVVITK